MVFSTLMLSTIGVLYWLDVTRTGGVLSAGVLGLLGILGVHEFVTMLRKAGFAVARSLLLVCTAALMVAAFRFGWREVDRELYPLVIATFLLLFPIALRSLLRERMARGLEEQGATLLAFISIAWPMYLAQGLVLRYPPAALYVVLVCKGGDIGGYLTGSFLGRHKLIPHISPGKTVEGAVGSLVASCVLAVLLRPVLLEPHVDLGLTVALLAGIMLNLTTQVGDLVESLLKRRCGVKDSASLLPAHGGVLDLIDSLLFSFPTFLLIVTKVT
ncbi:MAG: phosphatidate cytidylyltransferase [Planctomycetota bacterium]